MSSTRDGQAADQCRVRTIATVRRPAPPTPACPHCHHAAVPLAYGRASDRAVAAAAAGDLVLAGPRPAEPCTGQPDWACIGPVQHRFAAGPTFAAARTALVDAAYARHTR